MKLCFGTFAKILLFCGVDNIEKIKLINTIVRSVDPSCNLTSSAVTPLLQCTSNLPGKRSNSLGNVAACAENADPLKVAEYFSKKIVVGLLNPSKRKLAVLAICHLIVQDESISGDAVVEIVSNKSKTALLMQSTFALANFLAGVFLFVVKIDNKVGKDVAEAINMDFIVSFTELQDTISFVVPKKGDEIIDTASPVFIDYMTNARERYKSVKNLLYTDAPKPLYDFYVPNYVSHSIGRNRNGHNEQLITVTAESLTVISNFLIIEGVGGLGKSMMMRHLLLNAIDNFIKLRRVPIFLPLKDYSDWTGSLEDFIFSQANDFNVKITSDDFTFALNDGLFLLLFDGLDEIDCEHNKRFEREIEKFSDRHPKNCFVISSRPFQSFISFTRFSKMKLQPFTKEQALELVDKLEFRPDMPQIKHKFRKELDKILFTTHKSFAENPLLLTIMLLTFERYAEVPSKMHIFYREAFHTLAFAHDATKGAFKRTLKTGLNVDDFALYFAEICFRSYRDEKYEFTDSEFADYFNKLKNTDKSVTARNFLYDLRHHLCLMLFEGDKYYFIHRSFQEYFAAVFMATRTDEFIGKLRGFFENRSPLIFFDGTLPMLYGIIPERVEQFIFVPYLTALFDKCNACDGYWTFLEEEYSDIHYNYDIGGMNEWTVNEPKSYILAFILRQLAPKYVLSTDDLPFHESLVYETVPIESDTATWESDIVAGYRLEFNVVEVRKHPNDYSELLSILNRDNFIFKCEYNAARSYFEALTDKIQSRADDLNDLL